MQRSEKSTPEHSFLISKPINGFSHIEMTVSHDSREFPIKSVNCLCTSVNAETNDIDVEHAIEQSELTPSVAQTWSETLFYGVGNKDM